MLQITRGTTPPIEVEIEADLREADNVWLSLGSMRMKRIRLEGSDLELAYADGITTVSGVLTQEQTLSLPVGRILMQVRASVDGEAVATEAIPIEVLDVVDDEPIA